MSTALRENSLRAVDVRHVDAFVLSAISRRDVPAAGRTRRAIYHVMHYHHSGIWITGDYQSR
ncbi:hypothetical protein C9J85_11830 [Haloferax sp. wsp5]|nr:hypothetical protein C9J85_11830 [Haloferax sp. wsp5]